MKHFLLAFLVLCPGPATAAITYPIAKPRLVVVLVIDQFRADYLTRFADRFGNKGFKALIERGAYYPLAEYQHLQCVTSSGHATIMSGSFPYQSGITTNEWIDPTTGQEVYCVDDAKDGISPRLMRGTTVGDELKNAGYAASKVVGIALKDRAAVLMAGHRADLALWFSTKPFQWVSSSYYVGKNSLPDWVQNENKRNLPLKGTPYEWQGPAKTGTAAAPSFLHQATLGSRDAMAYPIGLELTEALAEAAITGMELGRDRVPDILAVSFSSHDYLGHKLGPNAREMEELTVEEDRLIEKLLTFIETQVPGGLKEVTVVLTGDHGAPPSSAWLTEAGKFDAGKIKQDDVVKLLETALNEKHGKPKLPAPGKAWIAGFSDFNFFLNPALFRDAGSARPRYQRAELQATMKKVLLTIPGTARVVTGTEIEAGLYPPGLVGRQLALSYFPGRSGDAILIPKPFYAKDDDYLVEHVTGYSYDRTVPLIIAGPGIRPGVYANKATINDIAPTLSFLLGTVPPALNEGRVLSELF